MAIDPGHPIPLYFQLKTLLLEAMIRGEYGPGERLPTEHELCDQFGLSRTPVSRALSELAEEGVILRHRRRGTFVNPHWVPRRGSELRILVPEEGPWEDLVRKTAPDDITINVVTVPRADLHHVLTHAVAEGRAPDLVVLDSVWIPEFAASGFLRSLDDLDEHWVRHEYEEDFLPPLIAAGRYQGVTYSVPVTADVAGMWHRKRYLSRASVEPPTTWEEFRAVGLALRRNGFTHPLALPGGSRGDETTTYCLLAFLAADGVEVMGREGILIDQQPAVDALAFLRRLVEDGILPDEAVGYEWNRPIRMLARGQAALSFGGSYEARALAESMGITVDKLDGRVGFTPFPYGPHGAPSGLAGTMVCGISRQAAQPERAFALLRRLVAAEPLATLGSATGRIPPRRSAVALAGTANPLLAASAQLLEHAVIRPRTPSYPRVSAQLQAMLESVLTARFAAAEAVSRTAQFIAAITGLPVVSGADRRKPV